MTQKQKLDIIKSLNFAKYKILEIYDPMNRANTMRFFAINDFTAPQNHITEIIVRGRDITSVIEEDSLSIHAMDLRNRDSMLLTKIEQIENQTVNFSSNFSYIYYLQTQDLRQF